MTIILEDKLVDSLMDYVEEMRKTQRTYIPISIKEPISDPIEKKRAVKRWKKSIGYHYLNPNRFDFSLKDL